jgi:transcriptional regulator with XRE-family HTH domain
MDIDEQQAAIRGLIHLMMEASGLDATSLARAAGLAPSTLTRFLNQPVKHLLTARTLAKLSAATGVSVPAGTPLLTSAERDLLADFRSTDDQGREMASRFLGSLRAPAGAPSNAPSRPKERAPPLHPTSGGSAAKSVGRRGCEKVVRLTRRPERV